MQLIRITPIALLVFSSIAGCEADVGPTRALDSSDFARQPEVHQNDGQYYLSISQKLGPETLMQVFVIPVGDDLRIHSGIYASDPSRKLQNFEVKIPESFRNRDLTHHFFWQDPDGTLHPLAVYIDRDMKL